MAYPTDLDSFSDVVDNTTDATAANHNAIQDAIEALEAKVGADSSAVTTSHDYMLNDSSSPIVTDTGTQTLTNKTLTSPVLTTPTINGATPDEDAKAAFAPEQYSLSITSSGFTEDRAVAHFSKTPLGVWMMNFRIGGTYSSGAMSGVMLISGVVFESTADQAITAYASLGSAYYGGRGRTGKDSGYIHFSCGGSATSWCFSGEVELDEKPSETYFSGLY